MKVLVVINVHPVIISQQVKQFSFLSMIKHRKYKTTNIWDIIPCPRL